MFIIKVNDKNSLVVEETDYQKLFKECAIVPKAAYEFIDFSNAEEVLEVSLALMPEVKNAIELFGTVLCIKIPNHPAIVMPANLSNDEMRWQFVNGVLAEIYQMVYLYPSEEEIKNHLNALLLEDNSFDVFRAEDIIKALTVFIRSKENAQK